jgi:flagellar hook-length control protein FliK
MAQPTIVLPQVLRGVESLVRSGANSMHLQLYPEALGRIDIQVTTNADGLRVTLTADSVAAGGLLQQHLSDLRQSLSESGLSIQALSVGIGQGQGGQQMSAWQRPPQTAGFMAAAHSQTAAAPEPALTPARAGAGTRVDYRI